MMLAVYIILAIFLIKWLVELGFWAANRNSDKR